MKTAAMQAAFKLLTTTPPERIHKFERDWDAQQQKGTRPPRSATLELHQRIVALHMEGKRGFEIARIVGKSKTTVSKHLTGKIKVK